VQPLLNPPHFSLDTKANRVIRNIHPRMPVILKKEDEEEWLNPDSEKDR
jgi:putative SOS response-associated peptidase YedK